MPTAQPPLAAPGAEPVALSRWLQPGGVLGHLFTTGPGWSRSLCRLIPWSAALRDAGDAPTCGECEQVRVALEAVPETEQRLLHGDR